LESRRVVNFDTSQLGIDDPDDIDTGSEVIVSFAL